MEIKALLSHEYFAVKDIKLFPFPTFIWYIQFLVLPLPNLLMFDEKWDEGRKKQNDYNMMMKFNNPLSDIILSSFFFDFSHPPPPSQKLVIVGIKMLIKILINWN